MPGRGLIRQMGSDAVQSNVDMFKCTCSVFFQHQHRCRSLLLSLLQVSFRSRSEAMTKASIILSQNAPAAKIAFLRHENS